jgi:sodium/bile acid cotransporter 7
MAQTNKAFFPDPFVLLMLGAVVLALIWPQLGAPDGILKLGLVTQYGIALVFFLHGANLSPQALLAGARNWRTHLLIQSTTFVLFPILGVGLYFLARAILPDPLGLGFFFLAALPSTVSSSVAMTGLGKGNVPVAVFNATLSGILGMILTPASIALVAATGSAHFSVLDAMLDIAMTLLAPFAIGQLCRPLIGNLLKSQKWIVGRIDRTVILLIVLSAFSASTLEGVWTKIAPLQLLITALLVVVTLAAAFAFTMLVARWRGLSRADEAAAVFCGSTKSIANGAPMARILFAGMGSLGPLLLPLMLYHQLQLMACAVLAQRYAERAKAEEAAVPS